MSSKCRPPSVELPSSPPAQSSFNFKNVARLSDSMWSSKRSTKANLLKSTQNNFTKETLDSPFSSDPITAQSLIPETSKTKLMPIVQKKRKCIEINPTVIQATKVMRIASPKITNHHTYLSAIQEARDLIVKAYHLTNDKEKQDAVLDLVEVFRNFTETGRANLIKIDKTSTLQATPTTSTPGPTNAEISPEKSTSNTKSSTISYAEILKSSAPAGPINLPPKPSTAMKVLGKPLVQGGQGKANKQNELLRESVQTTAGTHLTIPSKIAFSTTTSDHHQLQPYNFDIGFRIVRSFRLIYFSTSASTYYIIFRPKSDFLPTKVKFLTISSTTFHHH